MSLPAQLTIAALTQKLLIYIYMCMRFPMKFLLNELFGLLMESKSQTTSLNHQSINIDQPWGNHSCHSGKVTNIQVKCKESSWCQSSWLGDVFVVFSALSEGLTLNPFRPQIKNTGVLRWVGSTIQPSNICAVGLLRSWAIASRHASTGEVYQCSLSFVGPGVSQSGIACKKEWGGRFLGIGPCLSLTFYWLHRCTLREPLKEHEGTTFLEVLFFGPAGFHRFIQCRSSHRKFMKTWLESLCRLDILCWWFLHIKVQQNHVRMSDSCRYVV